MSVWWIGLETQESPSGFGEDLRTYVSDYSGDEFIEGDKIRAAIHMITDQLTVFEHGHRIAVRRVE